MGREFEADPGNGEEDDEFCEDQEGRVPFERSSLDKYRVTPPPSPSQIDELRAVIQLYSERNTIRLCRKGKRITRTDGSSYRVACGNRWSCPLCSPYWLKRDQERIERVLQSAPTVAYLTLTVPNDPGPPRAGSLGPILETWSAVFSTGSWMTDFKNRTGLLGWVRSIEVTFPEVGFNPHIHAAFAFSSKPRGVHIEALVTRWVHSSGQASHKAQNGRYVKSASDRGKVAFYLCEQNAIRQSRPNKGVTPGDLLHRVASTGDADALGLLLGFHEAVRGKQKISSSRGFWQL